MKPQTLCILLLAVVGCVSGDNKPAVDDTKGGSDGKSERWGSQDDPALFASDLEYHYANLPAVGEAANAPWAGNYWPTYRDNINDKWDGNGSVSAAGKYGQAFGVSGVEDAVSSQYGIDHYSTRTSCTASNECDSAKGEACAKRDGATTGRCIPTWWGICHAWAPAAMMLPEPQNPVTYNDVEFKVQDIKALVTLTYDRTHTRFVSLRCNLEDGNADTGINFDKYGRPANSNQECRDTNPGTFHVLLANYLGIQGQSFVYDRTFDYQVWNQPLRAYRIKESREVSITEAHQILEVEAAAGETFNAAATLGASEWFHHTGITVQEGTAFTASITGTGDADIYVRFGAQPTADTYDCRPYTNSSTEACNLTVPANATKAYVSVQGYAQTSDVALEIETSGIATAYEFNADAAKLVYVRSEVDYISESPAYMDGNLADSIDNFTQTDYYKYILEIDATGEIIGGEWVGSSKTAHPDFLWLPIGPRDSSVAGGKITYANVKMLLDLSTATNGGGGNGETVSLTEAGTISKGEWMYYGPFAVAQGTPLTAIMTGTNDADLYVRKGSKPTASAYDCRPYKNGSNEQCSVVDGQIWVGVSGYATSSDFSLDISYTSGDGGAAVDPPDTVTHIDETGSVASGEVARYTVNLLAGKNVVVRTFSESDVDLYIQMNQAPTTGAYLLRGYTTSGNETLAYTPQSSGVLHVMVHGYQAGGFVVRTADE